MRNNRTVEVAFHRSIAVTVSIASLVLASAEGTWWPAGLTPAVAILSHLLVDRKRFLKLPLVAANFLGLTAFTAMAVEFYGNTLVGKLLAGAHLLVYMTWVVLLMQKGIRQFWWLIALSVLQISVASVLTTAPGFGASLLLMLLLMIWTLSVFTLYRAQQRILSSDRFLEDSLVSTDPAQTYSTRIRLRHGLQLDPDERWIGPRFCGIAAFSFFASLGLGAVAFAIFPRIWGPETALSGMTTVRATLAQQTGFTETVELGEIGQIMQSDQRVLQLEITRLRDGQTVTPDEFARIMNMDELLLRGNALAHYREGRWTSGSNQGRSVGDLETARSFDADPGRSDFRIRITQDPPIATFAFAPMPVTNAVNKEDRGRIEQRRLSYSLVHRRLKAKYRSEPMNYEVWCAAPPQGQTFHSADRSRYSDSTLAPVWELFRPYDRREEFEATYARDWCITRGLSTTLPRLHQLATELCTQDGQLVSGRRRIRRIVDFLSTTGSFQYSLTASVDDPSIDPIEDFLINRKTGHCEYFASACVLMLQSVGVPARIVNGYKGGEENSVSGQWEVKQKHAHTWLEAYVDRHWETCDPTPAAAREESVSQSGAFDWWADLKAVFSDKWFNAVQKMSLQRQETLLRPWLDSARAVIDTVRQQGLWAALKLFYHEVILQPRKWISWQTGVVTFVLLLLIGLMVQRRPDRRLLGWLKSIFRQLRPVNQEHRTVVRFYEQFCTMCAHHGLTFPPQNTARENAALAATHFAPRFQDEADRTLPQRIADAFNQVRFGETIPSPGAISAVRRDVLRFHEILARRIRQLPSPGESVAD